MPISRRRSGIDIHALIPFNKEGSGVGVAGTLQTILSISGKGFLESFYGFSTPNPTTVKITVDGVVKVLLIATANNAVGVANKNDLMPSATAGNTAFIAQLSSNFLISSIINSFKPYPTVDSSNGIILLGDAKIYFYQSLLLEIQAPANNGYGYRYSGGYQ